MTSHKKSQRKLKKTMMIRCEGTIKPKSCINLRKPETTAGGEKFFFKIEPLEASLVREGITSVCKVIQDICLSV